MAADLINGEIPDHWEFTTLGEVCLRGGGNIQTGPFGSQLHASDYVPVGVPSIMPTNIGDNRIIEDGIVRITVDDANRLGQHRLRAGDIVYSRRGDVEKRALIRESEDGWLCGTGCLKVRFGSGIVDPLFASLFLGHPAIREWIVRHAVGATMPNLNTSIMSAVPFALPPLAEQKAIAAVLGALDDKIELNRRINAKLEAMARTLFQSWFVDFDPVRAKLDGRQPVGMDEVTAALFPDSFEESELGAIPHGWQVGKLKDLTSKIGSGATPRGGSEVYVDEGPALIRSQNVYDHEFHWAGLARLTEKSATELRNVEVMKNDVLLNITGDSILRTCVVDPAVLPARVNQHVAIIRATKGIPARFLHLYLVQDSMKSFLIGMSAGATRHAITKGHLESTEILKPSTPVLAAFEKLTAPWFEQIDTNRTQCRTLAILRDTLLPKLLRGELNLEGMNTRSDTA